MKYKGKELKEYISEEPIFFDPPKHMVCWTNPADDPTMECIVFSYDPRITLCVSARTPWNECRSFRHCAEIPEEYFALVVVEHRAVSGINRYGLGKFVTREDAKSVMDSMVELLGGDPKMGSKDIYIVPFNAVRGFPYGAYDNRMDMDRIPNYLVDAYDKAMKKFLGEEDTVRPRFNDLPSNAGEVYAPREENLNTDMSKRAAMVNRLREATECGLATCKRVLEECGWNYDKAYAVVKGHPPIRVSKESNYEELAAEETAREDSARDAELRTLKNKMVAELMNKTGWGAYHCMRALQACEWKSDVAERMLRDKFKDFASNK